MITQVEARPLPLEAKEKQGAPVGFGRAFCFISGIKSQIVIFI